MKIKRILYFIFSKKIRNDCDFSLVGQIYRCRLFRLLVSMRRSCCWDKW